MENRITRRAAVGACAGLLAAGSTRLSGAPAEQERAVDARTVRASKLMGLHVKNSAKDKIGTIEDLVINEGTGKVVYVAMGVGGVFGIGEKLFAIPLGALKFDHHGDDMAFVFDTTKEKLEASPGFNKEHWPDFADAKWTDQIDSYYGHPRNPPLAK